MKSENILVTNDDGINSKGLRALIAVAQEFGNVTVVAPEHGMSGTSHSISMFNPLFVRRIKESKQLSVYALEGTPVDCVKVAIDALMPQLPTLVLSGINHGANTNMSVIYSGTMGAATEGATYNITSIGFSHMSHETSRDMSAVMHFARKIIAEAIANREKGQKGVCLNVNVPDLPLEEIKGVRFCRQTRGYWKEDFDLKKDPRGREYFWLVGDFVNQEPDAIDTDEYAIKRGYVTIVPVTNDITSYSDLELCKNWNI